MKTQSQIIIKRKEVVTVSMMKDLLNVSEYTFMDFEHDADFNTIITFSDHA